MAVTRAVKEEELQDLASAFKGTESAIVVDYKGLKVPEVTELRRQVRGARGQYKVVKNTLAIRALKGTSFEPLGEFSLRCGSGMKASSVPDFVKACDSWMWRQAAVPSASRRHALAHR